MTKPTTQEKKDAVRAATGEIAKTLNEPLVGLVNRVVWHLGIEQAQTFLQQALEIEAQGGMMIADGQRRRTPGGVFFKLVKDHIAATNKRLYGRIFGAPKRKAKPPSDGQGQSQAKKPAKQGQPQNKKPAAPLVAPLAWSDALKYAHALRKHEKGEVKTVEVKLIGRPAKVAKAESCMIVMMEGKSAPKSLPTGLPTPPEQELTFAVFISNKHWQKVSDELKANANAELLVRGYPVFNPEKAMTLLLAQAVEVIERKPKKAKAQAP